MIKAIIEGDYTSFITGAAKGLVKAGLAVATGGTSLAATGAASLAASTGATSMKMHLLQEALSNLDTTPQPTPVPVPAPAVQRPAPTPSYSR